MNAKNPFATPSSASDSSQLAPNDWLSRLLPNAKATFLRWEYWRVVYCATCISATVASLFFFDKIPTCLLPGPPPTQPPSSWAELVVAGIVANFCYFAGPVVDTYLHWLGFKSRWVGISLFVLGTTFTVLVAFVVIAGYLR